MLRLPPNGDNIDSLHLRSALITFWGFYMPEPKVVPLINTEDVLVRQWIRKALETQRAVLIRSRTKEAAGSEIWAMRGREVEALTLILERVS